jgi:nitroreductase
MDKPAQTSQPIHDLIARRWSSRAFDPARPVAREALLSLLEAARWAPSSRNEQPWRFLVFDGSDPDALDQARSCLTEGNSWARRAPLLLLSVAKNTYTRDGSPNRYSQHDQGLASENLVLQAVALGLSAHQMGGFDSQRARDLFGIPDGFTPTAMIAISYPGDVEDLPPHLQEREQSPRSRKPLGEIAFSARWDQPLTGA